MLDSSGCTVCARRLDGRPSLGIEAPLDFTYPSTSSVTTQSLISAQGFHCSIGALHFECYYSELHKRSGFSFLFHWPVQTFQHAGHSLSGNRSFRDLKPMMSPEGIRTAGIPELTHCDIGLLFCHPVTRYFVTDLSVPAALSQASEDPMHRYHACGTCVDAKGGVRL